MASPEYQQQQAVPSDVLAELARLRAENERLRSERRWQSQLFANTAINSAAYKIILVAVRAEWERLRRNAGTPDLAPGAEPEPVPMYVEDIAKMAGVSRGTAGDALKALALMGAIHRRKFSEQSNLTGLTITRFAMAPTRRALDDPGGLAPEEKRNHGGKRTLCGNCGSDRVIERRQLICEDCGTVLQTTQHYVNGPADELDGAPEPVPEPEQELAPASDPKWTPPSVNDDPHNDPRIVWYPPEQDSPTVAATPEILPASQDDSPGQENEDTPDTESEGYEPW